MPRGGLARVNTTVLAVALAVTAVDALVAAWARSALAGHPVHLVGPAWLRLRFNAGLSFSLHAGGATVATVATLAVALAVLVVGLRARRGAPAVGFGLLIGGGVANAVDRLASSPHRVTDYVAVGSFPTFNLADAAITAGFVVLVAVALSGRRLLA